VQAKGVQSKTAAPLVNDQQLTTAH
jgi:hypothetical protein